MEFFNDKMDINILDLHFDILTLICEQIETFDDKKNFARTHPRLWNVFAYQYRKDIQSVIYFEELEDDMITHWDFILEWWGLNVTSIYNRYNYVNSGDLLEIAAKFCPNLEFVQFVIKEDNIKKVEENLPKLKMLKDIRMRTDFICLRKHNYKPVTHIADLIESLQSLTNLRHLNFGSHSLKRKERKQLNKLIQLEELKIGPIKESHVDDLSTLLGYLRVLMIEYYPDTKTISCLAKHCINLERLSLKDYENRSLSPGFSTKWRVAYFPKLTFLHVFKESCQNPFLSLDDRYNDQLQVLNIPCLTMGEKEMVRIANLRALKVLFCMDILPSSIDVIVKMQLEQIHFWHSKNLFKMDLLRLVKGCSSLKSLTCACHGIDNEFLSELLNILKAKGFQPDQPFHLNTVTYIETEVKKDLMTQFTSMPNSNLMHLQLD
ncbi:uncharacterized protein LOC117786217 [Drosophila innubila]|uniref:uncharacterized protein LOC117786217 n=1 Tax=Drosophila innubila TaxID=198719 RepID=UPI00148CBD29|nr:uncharacterized protein LOC117786217 [Drosophila innubila]